ncbi:hypothetical protein [Pseudoalteromonas sp. GB56]
MNSSQRYSTHSPIFVRCVFISVVLLLFSLPTSIAFGSQKQPPLRISYIEHPSVQQTALPLVKMAYQNAGIDAKFIRLPDFRFVNEIHHENIDGDVVQIDFIIDKHAELKRVGPPISEVEFLLICTKRVECSNRILGDKDIAIVTTDIGRRAIKTLFPQAANNRYFIVNHLGRMPKILATGHADYAFYIVSSSWSRPADLITLQHITLFKSEAYHILHERHADIAERIAPQIEALLANPPSELKF